MSEDMPPLPRYAFMACCLVKHRDNFTLLYFTLLSGDEEPAQVLNISSVRPSSQERTT
jgi:hypothetical protein